MKFKNKYTNKIIASGLAGCILLSSNPFNSFANINRIYNNISTINAEGESIEEISPQMLAVLSSLAVASGITITTEDDLYDLGRMFYDYIDRHNDLSWSTVQSVFATSVYLQANKLVSVKSDFLDIVKDFFDVELNGKESLGSVYFVGGLPYIPSYSSLSDVYKYGIPFYAVDSDFSVGSFDFKYVSSVESYKNSYDVYSNGALISSNFVSFVYSNPYEWLPRILVTDSKNNSSSYMVRCIYNTPTGIVSGSGFTVSKSFLDSFSFPYDGGYVWDNVENKKENESVSLPIPGDLGQLVGQTSEEFWNNAENLINPCTQKITIPEIENSSISIGESIKLQTEGSCSVYNEEQLVVKAEGTREPSDIENARNEVNKLPESQDKEELQNRLDAIVPNIDLNATSGTANIDVYIKSENMLSLSLDTNTVTFDGYSGTEPMEKLGAVNITVDSSLPYNLNAYMPTEIKGSNDTNKIEFDVFNIKESTEDEYQQFENNTDKIILKQGCESGNDIKHSIDLKLDSNNAYVADIYKTVIRFEAEQK